MPPEPTAKRVCASGPAGAGDRLSGLPDGLLHAVMSFLPSTRQVVRTSVLSRRWRGLWRSTPRISIDERDFGITSQASQNDLEEKWVGFENFTTNFLLFRADASSLGMFRVIAHMHNKRDVDRWIRCGIKYCPQALVILILGDRPPLMELPHLGSSSCRLKRIYLGSLCLDRHFAELLISGFPVLEDLELLWCQITLQNIRSLRLKRLIIRNCYSQTEHSIVITAPSLRYFHLSTPNGSYQNGICLCKVDSLEKALIDISSNSFSQKNEGRLLGSLPSVTKLWLGHFQMAILNEKADKLPFFPNMRALSLKACFLECDMKDKLDALGSFLENAPCLEKLTLQGCLFGGNSETGWNIKRKSVTLQSRDQKTFRCQKLKLIEVMYDHDHDHQLIELLWVLGKRLPNTSIVLTSLFTIFLSLQCLLLHRCLDHLHVQCHGFCVMTSI